MGCFGDSNITFPDMIGLKTFRSFCAVDPRLEWIQGCGCGLTITFSYKAAILYGRLEKRRKRRIFS